MAFDPLRFVAGSLQQQSALACADQTIEVPSFTQLFLSDSKNLAFWKGNKTPYFWERLVKYHTLARKVGATKTRICLYGDVLRIVAW